ncbi:OsmC family protein [Agromyces aerolatus]|uniref:OsmC family protein n=1 Tax=Agromyces sp. LY-1074 TaxID=3074080 RepID=UPI002858696A|nr:MULTISPECIES: OsmC family protein [unclassified Agromyces]MDR5701318.1 OsmC family protein [Agromyces sp. LY-1074]MDR5707576.1 OsmC family protein [Agromyces sp. LY-1358]
MRLGEHGYAIEVEWTGDQGAGTTGPRSYRRTHVVRAEGKLHELQGSADRVFHGDRERWNPEELLLAALADCHLMSFLYAASRSGVVVRAYTDSPTALLREDGRGGGAIVEAVLRPRVVVSDASMIERAQALHAEAAELCFINSSVAFPVRHEPVSLVE